MVHQTVLRKPKAGGPSFPTYLVRKEQYLNARLARPSVSMRVPGLGRRARRKRGEESRGARGGHVDRDGFEDSDDSDAGSDADSDEDVDEDELGDMGGMGEKKPKGAGHRKASVTESQACRAQRRVLDSALS